MARWKKSSRKSTKGSMSSRKGKGKRNFRPRAFRGRRRTTKRKLGGQIVRLKTRFVKATKRVVKSWNPLMQYPDRLFYKSQWDGNYTINSPDEHMMVKYMNLNNLRNPDPTLTMDASNAPTGWNNVKNQYRYYLVHGCKAKIKVYLDSNYTPTSAINGQVYNFNLGIMPIQSQLGNVVPNSWQDFIGSAKTKWRKGSVSPSRPYFYITQYFDCAAVECVSKERYRTTSLLKSETTSPPQIGVGQYVGQFGSTTASDPTSVIKLFILAQPTSGVLNNAVTCPSNLKMDVSLKYYVEIWNKTTYTGQTLEESGGMDTLPEENVTPAGDASWIIPEEMGLAAIDVSDDEEEDDVLE